MGEVDLFGYPIDPPRNRTKSGKRKTVQKGYAQIPGTGPQGETCRTCKHCRGMVQYSKCLLMREHWTHGKGSDIKQSSPACSKWEAKQTKKASDETIGKNT